MTLSIGRRIVGMVGAVVLAATAFVVLAAPAGAVPNGVVIVDDGEVCRIGAIDLGTGAVTNLQDTDCSDDLAFGPDGTLYGIVDEELVTYNPADGSTTSIGALGETALDTGGLTFDATGRLWLTILNDNTPCISINGVVEPEGTDPTLPETVVVPTQGPQQWCLYEVNPATGDATFVSPLLQSGVEIINSVGLAGSCDNRVLGNYFRIGIPAGDPQPLRLGSFNTATGVVTDIGDNGNVVLGLDFEPALSGNPQTLWGVGAQFGAAPIPSVYQLNQATGAATPTNAISGIGTDLPIALAIAPISCPAAVVTIQPTFTG